MYNSGYIKSGLELALEDRREEAVQQFLAKHDDLLLKTFCPVGTYICLPKLRFGTEYVSDFLIVQLWSTVTQIILIELEPPMVSPFTQSGTFARRLNGAIQQLNNWFAWVRENDTYFYDSILRCVREASEDAWRTLQYRIKYNSISGKIIIGRRSMISEADNNRRAAFFLASNRTIEIVPYDRLLDFLA